jgi:hypothetical protein
MSAIVVPESKATVRQRRRADKEAKLTRVKRCAQNIVELGPPAEVPSSNHIFYTVNRVNGVDGKNKM